MRADETVASRVRALSQHSPGACLMLHELGAPIHLASLLQGAAGAEGGTGGAERGKGVGGGGASQQQGQEQDHVRREGSGWAGLRARSGAGAGESSGGADVIIDEHAHTHGADVTMDEHTHTRGADVTIGEEESFYHHVLIVGDNYGYTQREEEEIERLEFVRKTALPTCPLLASHCIVILHHYLDLLETLEPGPDLNPKP